MKRINLFAGHYGSGKTNIAVNMALRRSIIGLNVVIADLDIVNPYFRTRDSKQVLEDAGIRLISSEFASSNVDLPALPSEAYSVLDDKRFYAYLDVGGDDRGALALGRYRDGILKEDNYDMFFVVNFFRPLTKNAVEAHEALKEIEAASGIKFTYIINNSNLGEETTAEDVISKLSEAKKLSEMTGLQIAYTTVREDLFPHLVDSAPSLCALHLQPKII